MTGEDKSGVYRRVPALLVDYVYTLITYLNFAQSNGNMLRPEQGEQTRGQSFGKWVG